MKVWSTLTALLGVAAAAASAAATDAVAPVDDADAYTYRYHTCNYSSQCGGYFRCGHYSYWVGSMYYDYATCVSPTTCSHWITRGYSRAYVYCY